MKTEDQVKALIEESLKELTILSEKAMNPETSPAVRLASVKRTWQVKGMIIAYKKVIDSSGNN